MFDCLKGLIGFCQSEACLGVAPLDMQFTPASGVWLDKHTAFKAVVITENTGYWNAENWVHIAEADIEVRRQLGIDLLAVIRKKVNPTVDTLRMEIGENRGAGYHSTPLVPIVVTLPTKTVKDASFYLTHIGIRAKLLVSPQTVAVVLKKNGTTLSSWDVVVHDMSDVRFPLSVPYLIQLDGSVYTLEYTYTATMFPTKNPMDCGCDLVTSGYACFFHKFTGDAGGVRLLGEVRCNETAWPCAAVTGPITGLHAAIAYRAYFVSYLLRQLVTARMGKPNAFTIIKVEDVGPIIESLQGEYGEALANFGSNWNPTGSCCYEVKTLTDIYSAI